MIRNQLQKENSSLNNNDISKITISFSFLDPEVKTQVNLIISINSTTSTLRIDVEKTNLLKGLSIINVSKWAIFQDQFKNLWAAGRRTNLQVLEIDSSRKGYDESTGWTSADDSRLTKSLNIANGWSGSIFQDEFKNLWAMSRSVTKTINKIEKTIYTKLQVFKVNVAKDGYVNLWQKPSD